jgi:hypothetical protein
VSRELRPSIPQHRRVATRRPIGLLLAVLLLAAACGGGDGSVSWRDVSVEVPEDWTVFEEEDSRLSMSNVPMGTDVEAEGPEDLPEGDVLAMFFRHEPGIRPGDWRDYIEGLEEATIESDDALELDGEVPATRLVFSHVTGGTPTREMVVLVPSRDIEVLAQPVPGPGDTDAPDVFLRHVATFNEVVESMSFGAPVD